VIDWQLIIIIIVIVVAVNAVVTVCWDVTPCSEEPATFIFRADGDGDKRLRNVRNHLPKYTVSHYRRP
jgi:hypothetical protein